MDAKIVNLPSSKVYDAWTRIYQGMLKDLPRTEQQSDDMLEIERFLELTLV